ncbi:MAG: hypothetical protein ABIA76_05485 [Candidatus Diapherotrites archaeon]
MVYHLGKIMEIFSFDSKEVVSAEPNLQVTVKMWDENQLIMDVDQKIALKIKKNDIVLVDYNPVQIGGQAVPKQIIVKILNKKLAERAWNSFKEYSDKKKNQKQSSEFGNQGMIR